MMALPFNDKELTTISEVQSLSKQIAKIDKKLKTAKGKCDKFSKGYQEANRMLEQQLCDRHDLIMSMSSLKLKLMRDMNECGTIPKSDAVVIIQPNEDQIGRPE